MKSFSLLLFILSYNNCARNLKFSLIKYPKTLIIFYLLMIQFYIEPRSNSFFEWESSSCAFVFKILNINKMINWLTDINAEPKILGLKNWNFVQKFLTQRQWRLKILFFKFYSLNVFFFSPYDDKIEFFQIWQKKNKKFNFFCNHTTYPSTKTSFF